MLKLVRGFLLRLEVATRILAIRCSYAMVLRRIRNRPADEKIRVLFLVNEISKWKAQSLCDLMMESGAYEPMIGITLADIDDRLSDVEQRAKMATTRKFFAEKGMKTVDMFDCDLKTVRTIDEVGADVVFYQQPYVFFNKHLPFPVSFKALTCYIPYYVTNYGTRSFDYEYDFHKEIWRYFILSEGFARAYRHGAWFFNYAGKLLGLGHTGLDYYHLHKDVQTDQQMVIYAPHWSFGHPRNVNNENYSTFLWTGRSILAYALKHPEIKWVFRPHPSLAFALRQSRVWTEKEIADYWAAWQKVGTLSTGGDYQRLILESRAMITDCGSFLIEYFVTGKPLVHLISKDVKVQPIAVSKEYFDSFYQVKSEEDLTHVLDEVISGARDPRREERLAVLKKSGLLDCSAAKNILRHLNKMLGVL